MGYLFALDFDLGQRYSSPLPKIDEQPAHRRATYELDLSDSDSDSDAPSSPSSSLAGSFDDLPPLSHSSSHSSSSSSLVSFASEAESDDARDTATTAADGAHPSSSFPRSPTLPPSPPLCPFSLSDFLVPLSTHSTNPPPAPRLPARTMLFPVPPCTSSPPPPYPHHEYRQEFGLGLDFEDHLPVLERARREDSPMECVERNCDEQDSERLGLWPYESKVGINPSADWFQGQGGDWELQRDHKRRRTLFNCNC